MAKRVGADLLDRFVCYNVVSVGLVHHTAVGSFHHTVDEEGLVRRYVEQGETPDEQVVVPRSDNIEPIGLKVCWKESVE